jgi:hypothetical protein
MARLARVEAALSGTRITFRHESGRRMHVPTRMVLSAFFRYLGGEVMGLPAPVSEFLSRAVVPALSSDFERIVVGACKEQYAVAPTHPEMRDGPSDLPGDA